MKSRLVDNHRLEGVKWVPFSLLVIGLLLKGMNIDEHGILLNIGFIGYGLVTLLEGIRGQFYKQLTIDTLRIVLPMLIILLASDNLLTGDSNYTLLGFAIPLPYLVAYGQRSALKGLN